MAAIDVTKLNPVDIGTGSVLGVKDGGVALVTKSSIVEGLAKTTDLASPSASAGFGFVQNGTDVQSKSVESELRSVIRAQQFKNVDPTGATDSSVGIANAIAEAKRLGADLDLGPGTFLLNGIAGADGRLNGILLPFTSANGQVSRVRILGRGKSTVLRAGVTNMTIARVSDSHSGISNVTYDANGKTGVWGLQVSPENVNGTSTLSYQNFNVFNNFYIIGCDEGIVMQCGPRVAGVDSGCWYNLFDGFHIYFGKRGIWLRDGPNANSSGVNANQWHSGRVGQSTNTGIQIDAGSGNRGFGLHFEGVNAGTSPNSVPTAIKISSAGTQGGNNDSNQFFGTRIEAATLHLDNQNSRTVFVGGEVNAALFSGVKPSLMIGSDPALMPLILPGMEYAEGTPGYTASGYWGMKKPIVDIGFNWNDWALTDATARVVGVSSVSSAVSKFNKLNDVVEWHFVVKFNANAAGQQISIIPPILPNAALYCNTAGTNPFMTLAVEDGTGTRKIVEAGWLNGSRNFYVKSPGNWNVGGNNNFIMATLRYHT